VGSPVTAADWNSFELSIAPPGASLGSKTSPVAEIVTRATERFGKDNSYVNQSRASLAAMNAIFYAPSKWELIGRLWRFCVNPESILAQTAAFSLPISHIEQQSVI